MTIETQIAAARQVGASAGDLSALQQLRQRVADFQSVYAGMRQRKTMIAQSPHLRTEYDALMARGNRIFSTLDVVTRGVNTAIDSFRTGVDKVTGWLRATFGFGGSGLGDLGLVPALWIVGIIGASGVVALINNWISDAYLFGQRWDAIKELIDQGVAPAEAARIVESQAPAGLFGNLSKLVMPITIGLILWMLVGMGRRP